jgi:SAM-dependent methyltransferase
MKDAPSCRLCDARPDQQSIKSSFVFGGQPEHKFWECANCGLVHLFPIPSVEDEARFYRLEFEKFMLSRSGKDRDWTGPKAHIASNQPDADRRILYLRDHISTGAEVLDVGCSSGFMMEAISSFGAKCWGIEPSVVFKPYLVDQGKFPVFDSLEALSEEHPEQKFDVVVHFFVLEHIRDPVDFLMKQLDLLRPGGKIIAEIPCVNDPLVTLYPTKSFDKFYWSIAHHYYYSPQSLEYHLGNLGHKLELFPDQRYDLGNHTQWMLEGRPGGQGRLDEVFSDEFKRRYAQSLKEAWLCDTVIAVISKST